MPADVAADLNLLDTQVTTLIAAALVVVAATALNVTQGQIDSVNTALLAIGATRARIISGRQQP